MKRTFIIGVLSVLTFVIAFLCSCKNTNNTKDQLPTVDTATIDTVSYQVTPEQAVEDMLLLQHDVITSYKYDSTFRQIPIEIIGIIVQNNTNFTSYDVAEEYLNNKDKYDLWLQNYRQIEKIKEKHNGTAVTDTIPAKAKNDIPITKL